MSYAALPPAIRHTAETHLTPKQLHVLKLHLAGCGARRISTMLQIHRTTVRDHLKAALDALEAHGVVSDVDRDAPLSLRVAAETRSDPSGKANPQPDAENTLERRIAS